MIYNILFTYNITLEVFKKICRKWSECNLIYKIYVKFVHCLAGYINARTDIWALILRNIQ